MKKTVAVTILVLAIVIFSIVYLQSVHPKSSPKIIIKQNGSVVPSTAPIARQGETYTFTGNIRNQIVLERGSIILDGGGFSLEGNGGGIGLNMTCSNATVQNLNIIDWQDGVLGVFNNNTIRNCLITQCDDSAIGIFAQEYSVIRDNITSNNVGVVIGKGGLNFIAGNNIINNDLGISLEDSNNEIVQNNIENCSNGAIFLDITGWSQTVFHNNFINNQIELSDGTYGDSGRPVQSSLPFWDNGSSGNYWSDYTGIDVNGDGIGDSPNMITTYVGNNELASYSFVDRYPLVTPFNINKPIPQEVNLTSTTVPSTVSIANDQATALSFLKNVIQLDVTKYTITLTYDTERTTNGFSTDYLAYNLVHFSDGFEASANAIFAINNNSVTSFTLQPTGGQLFFTTPTTNSFDSAKRIMQNYQIWTHDSEVNKMINLLNTAGSENNITELLGDIQLKISTTSEQTSYIWNYIYQGTEYTSVSLEFQNLLYEPFISFSDNREIYHVCNTNVNFSKQQAIQVAEDYVRNLSYELNYGNGSVVTVKGLIVNETDATATLSTTSRYSATLYPYWSAQVPLVRNYPAETYAVTVGIWAGNGTIFSAQRDVVPKSFPIPHYTPPSLYALIFPLIIALLIVLSLTYLLVTTSRKSRTIREIFVSGRTTAEVKDEVLRLFSQNNVGVMENYVDYVKGRWGTGMLTAAKYFQLSFKQAEGGVKVHAEGWIGILGVGEQSFSKSALMGWIPRREGWKAMEKLLSTLGGISRAPKVCPQCGRTLNGYPNFCQYCGKQLQ